MARVITDLLECERLAADKGAELAEAREALDLAVWNLYAVPEELRLSPKSDGQGGK